MGGWMMQKEERTEKKIKRKKNERRRCSAMPDYANAKVAASRVQSVAAS